MAAVEAIILIETSSKIESQAVFFGIAAFLVSSIFDRTIIVLSFRFSRLQNLRG